ncbi:Mechanosensitive ion channel protein 10 [Acorus gramineus]|uniref:Mechanosensitive ion channel protein n=1 Tax=Acorus gramineus TaxID=55184 RepID=A0AAV9AFR1_ACOGR|nr:Mechanosensitive ion channel protein 10 [Acorus gramineus]
MDGTVRSPPPEEVVLVISRNGEASASASDRAQPPDRLKSAVHKPPRPPTSPQTHASLSRSSFSKPKSRFVEEPPPPRPITEESVHRPSNADRTTARTGSHNNVGTPRSAGGTPRTPGDDEEEEEEEIYKREQNRPQNEKKRKKLKFWLMFEWTVLIAAVACLVSSLAIKHLENRKIWGLEIWKWCLMVAVVFCGRLFSDLTVWLLVFLIERNFLLKKKVLYFVYSLQNSVRICVWSALILLSWHLFFNRGVTRSQGTEKVLFYVSRALLSLLVGALLWTVKIVLVKLLASSFHMNTFFDRIQESIFNQYVLQTLSGPPTMELAEQVGPSKSGQLSLKSMKKGKDEEVRKGVIDVGRLHRMKQGKVSAWTMKGLIGVIGNSGLSTLSNALDESYGDTEITSEWEAKAAAYKIFYNVAKPNCKYIDEEDLLRFLNKEEVANVLKLFEGTAETRKIKKSALKNWVVKAYLDRKSLAHSLNDTKTAINQLHKLASVVTVIVIIIIWLLLMGFATTKVLVLFSSQLLLVGFMFSNTCKTVFEAIVFVFVTHPFDVGDRCVIDGVQMVVEEMNILTTVFLRYDNEKIYYPNALLSMKPISNFYRSPDMGDSIEFSIAVSTSVESIVALKARIKAYLENKPHHWHPKHSIVVKDIVDVNKMNMALYVTHTMNFQNMAEKTNRRSELVFELKKIFEELSIEYHLLPQEVQISYANSMSGPASIGRP